MNGGPDLYSFRELWRQYRNCRRNKRNTINTLAFEIDAGAKLLALQWELQEHAYCPLELSWRPTMKTDLGIKRTRDVRQRISASVADHPARMIHYYVEMQGRFGARLLHGPAEGEEGSDARPERNLDGR